MHNRFRWTFLLTLVAASLVVAPLAVMANTGMGLNSFGIRTGKGNSGEAPTGEFRDPVVLYDRTFEPVLEGLGLTARNAAVAGDYIATPSGFVSVARLGESKRHFRSALDTSNLRSGDVALVHFGSLSMEQVRNTLQMADVTPLGELPNNAIVVTGVTDLAAASLSRAGATLLAWTPGFFVSPSIGTSPVPNAAMAADPNLQLLASVFPGVSEDSVTSVLSGMGATVTGSFNGVISFSMNIDDLRGNLELLSGLGIRSMGERGFVVSADEDTNTGIQTGEFNAGARPYTAAGINGSTQVVGVSDTGLSLDAAVLSDGTAGVPGSGTASPAGLGHRKVVAYVTAASVAGGGGDLLSCDGTSGVTHGHVVASLIAGNASDILVDLRALSGFEPGLAGTATPQGIDGVAPAARVYFVDTQVAAQCSSAEQIEAQNPGSLSGNAAASRTFGVNNSLNLKVHNFSFSILGSESSYTVEAQDIDTFLHNNQDFLVTVAAGNRGIDSTGDGNLDFGTITSPGTAKNVVTVGSSGYPNNALDPENSVIQNITNRGIEIISRFASTSGGGSSQGPAAFTVTGSGAANWRIKPDVMAPGDENLGNQRLTSPTTCISGDNDQANPVECSRLLPGALEGTSFASAAAAGSAAVIRDYFRKGFAPAGQSGGAVVNLTGPQLKAALIASADLMTGNPSWGQLGGQLQLAFYNPKHLAPFSPEQGYGRIQLNKLLPLSSEVSSPSFISTESISLSLGAPVSRSFSVVNGDEAMRCAVSWYDKEATSAGPAAQGNLVRNVNMVVFDCGPNGICADNDDVRYNGNYFNEDTNFDRALLDIPAQFACSNNNAIACDPNSFDPLAVCGDAGATCDPVVAAATEDCNGNGVLDSSEFSLPLPAAGASTSDCDTAATDSNNNNEAVFLSPSQLTQGRTMRVDLNWASSTEGSPPANITVGLVCTGGIAGGGTPNSVRANKNEFTCADALNVSVIDGQQNASVAGVESNVTVVSKNSSGTVIDTESGLIFSELAASTRYRSAAMAVVDSNSVPPSNNDSLLGVADGGSIEVRYVDGGQPDAVAKSTVRCSPNLSILNIGRRGTNANFGISGGCDPRGRIDPRFIVFGAVPGTGSMVTGDLFLDKNEDLVYSVAFTNQETGSELLDVRASLKACVAGSIQPNGSCTAAAGIDIFDANQTLGNIQSGKNQTASFNIHVRDTVSFPNQVQMVFGLAAVKNGLTASSTTVFHHVLNADNWSKANESPAVSGAYYYSTDFPTGGREIRVWAGEFFDPLNPDLAGPNGEEFLFQDMVTAGSLRCIGGADDQKACTVNANCSSGVCSRGNARLLGFNAATGRFDSIINQNWPWTFDLNDEGWGPRRRFDSDPGDNLELQARNTWQWGNTGECGFQSNDPSQTDFNTVCVGGSQNGQPCDIRQQVPGAPVGPPPDSIGTACNSGGGVCTVVRGTGGIWHTGHFQSMPGTPPGRTGYDLGCEDYDLPGSADPKRERVVDTVSSPHFFRVRHNLDSNGFAYQLEFLRFGVNMQFDIGDGNTISGYELDPDTRTSQPVDPLDLGWLASDQGTEGFLSATSQGPYSVWNPNDPHEHSSVTLAGGVLNAGPGPGQNIAFIQGRGSPGSFIDVTDPNKAPARSFGEVKGLLTGRGIFVLGPVARRGGPGFPFRNTDAGFEIGAGSFEDIFGPNETRSPSQTYPITSGNPEVLSNRRDSFQVNMIMVLRENANPAIAAIPSYGVGFDDVVVEWREQHPVADRTPCSDPSTWATDGDRNPLGGPSSNPSLTAGCASISWDRSAILQPETSLALTVIDTNAVWGPDGIALNGDEQAVDSNSDGLAEITVPVSSDSDLAGELFTLTQIALNSPVFRGVVKVSSTKGLTSATDGVIFIQENGDGTNPTAVNSQYVDQDINVAGSGIGPIPCPDNPLIATVLTQFVGSDVLFVTAKVTDEGPNADGDNIADAFETVKLDISVVNSVLDVNQEKPDLEDVTITLVTASSNIGANIACILDGSSFYGTLESGIARFNNPADPFRFVVGTINRPAPSSVVQAEFSLGIQGRYVDSLGVERRVTSFATPQRFAINLHLDIQKTCQSGPSLGSNCTTDADCGGAPGSCGTPQSLQSNSACVGGVNAGRACFVAGDCPSGSCDPLPAYLQSGGTGFVAGSVGYFEGFEGSANMAGRQGGFTAGPWPKALTGSSIVHSPAVNAAGGYLDGGNVGNTLDFQPGPLTPGAARGNGRDDGGVIGQQGQTAVDGLRCQYNDPKGPSKHPRSEAGCRPWNGSAWHVNDNKAFTGGKSMYSGVNGTEDLGLDDSFDTGHTNALYSAFSSSMNVGVAGNATLSLYHIVQTADDRTFNVPAGNAAGRGHVEWVEVNNAGTPIGGWQKLNGFQNNYGNTGVTPFFVNCIFDSYDEFDDAVARLGNTPGWNQPNKGVNAVSPVGVFYNADDVGSEDDYFDPNDPLRLFGPSGSCFPQFVFASLGDYTSTNIAVKGKAFTDGELGQTGNGVWVNTLMNLDAAAGKTIRIRFVFTDIDISSGITWSVLFGNRLGNATRGWRIDDVAVSGLVQSPLTLLVDGRPLSPAPATACPTDPAGNCNTVTANAGPDIATPVSGSAVSLDASASSADQCVNGFLEYRWRIGGTTVQDFSTNPVLSDAPQFTTVYIVDVRCSTDQACANSDSVTVVPADELEVSGVPGELGSVDSAGPGGGPGQPALTRWVEPPVGGPHTISVFGVNLQHNGAVLRNAGGGGASGSSMSAALRANVCNLGTALNVGGRNVEFTDTTLAVANGEVVGYLAVTTNGVGIVGTLGRGEQIGAPAAFSRGRVSPGALSGCTP